MNGVLTAVRGLLSYAVSVGEAPRSVLGQICELADSRDLPLEAQGEDSGLSYRLRARHRVQGPEADVDRATDNELVAMFLQCRNARDRLIVLLHGRVGLRRGQVAGLRRSDCHLLPDSKALGCDYEGPHLHVRRRDNPNGAWSQANSERRRQRVATAIKNAAKNGTPISVSAVARQAGVDRTFLYRHRDLLELVHAAEREPGAQDPAGGSPVSRASLQADLANAQARNTRLAANITLEITDE
ncbi:DUF6262 family protein [Streptomyces griseoruber]|uniref:DUF6262 family protein n=1 Tax=Streptomyces griseoruber TaxID=1943 RepID=UPI0037AC195D